MPPCTEANLMMGLFTVFNFKKTLFATHTQKKKVMMWGDVGLVVAIISLSQVIRLFTLNKYPIFNCQFYLNKAGRKETIFSGTLLSYRPGSSNETQDALEVSPRTRGSVLLPIRCSGRRTTPPACSASTHSEGPGHLDWDGQVAVPGHMVPFPWHGSIRRGRMQAGAHKCVKTAMVRKEASFPQLHSDPISAWLGFHFCSMGKIRDPLHSLVLRIKWMNHSMKCLQQCLVEKVAVTSHRTFPTNPWKSSLLKSAADDNSLNGWPDMA